MIQDDTLIFTLSFSAPKADETPKTCSSKQFVCKDQVTCISKGWRCDGEKDCPDGSDESPEICKHDYVNAGTKTVSQQFCVLSSKTVLFSSNCWSEAIIIITAFTLSFLEIAILQIDFFFF